MDRYLTKTIENLSLAHHKLAILSGPRQVGKTTCAKHLLQRRGLGAYFNWDDDQFRVKWVKNPKHVLTDFRGSIQSPLILLDEIHKDPLWKRRVKGLYDTRDIPADFVITGSARLNVYQKGGDSLVGRAFHYRLHPLTLGETLKTEALPPDELIAKLVSGKLDNSELEEHSTIQAFMAYGTFPEPFLKREPEFLRAWRQARRVQIINEDVRDVSNVQELRKLGILLDLVTERVGSLIGKSSLRETLEVSFETINRWLSILADLFLVFEIMPFTKGISRALRRERKVYLWEISGIPDLAARFENLVALHLLKTCDLWNDMGVGNFALSYLRNKEKQELDFLVTRDGKAWLPIEVKLSEETPAPAWRKMLPALKVPVGLQLVQAPGVQRRYNADGQTLLVRSAADFLALLA